MIRWSRGKVWYSWGVAYWVTPYFCESKVHSVRQIWMNNFEF